MARQLLLKFNDLIMDDGILNIPVALSNISKVQRKDLEKSEIGALVYDIMEIIESSKLSIIV
ncbi:uncharacterized protein G2W53_027861 [Senna tora]|nr:uncharacterized protein G2W53_027861 [Senna tora]